MQKTKSCIYCGRRIPKGRVTSVCDTCLKKGGAKVPTLKGRKQKERPLKNEWGIKWSKLS